MIIYKIKHRQTGLFYTPSRGGNNLTSKGKIYDKRPCLKLIDTVRVVIWKKRKYTAKEQAILDCFGIEITDYKIDKRFGTPESQWEIVTV